MNKIYEWTALLNLLFVNFINSLGNKQLQSRRSEKLVKKTRKWRIVVRRTAGKGFNFCSSDPRSRSRRRRGDGFYKMIPCRGADVKGDFSADERWLSQMGRVPMLGKKFPNIGKKRSGGGESFNKMMNSKIISNSWIKKSFPWYEPLRYFLRKLSVASLGVTHDFVENSRWQGTFLPSDWGHLFAFFVEGFWRNVRAIGPSDCSSFNAQGFVQSPVPDCVVERFSLN